MTEKELYDYYLEKKREAEGTLDKVTAEISDPETDAEYQEYRPYMEALFREKTNYRNYKRKIREYRTQEARKEARAYYEEKEIDRLIPEEIRAHSREILETLQQQIRKHFSQSADITLAADVHYHTLRRMSKGKLTKDNVINFIMQLSGDDAYFRHPGRTAFSFRIADDYLGRNDFHIFQTVENVILKRLQEDSLLQAQEKETQEAALKRMKPELTQLIRRNLRSNPEMSVLRQQITGSLGLAEILGLIAENPNFLKVRGRLLSEIEAIETEQQIHGAVLQCIPEHLPDLYPNARSIRRKFILHIGPTNSGKTYSAIKDLESARSGIYLAPLRLLAFEQYDRINRDGLNCSLITGEEKIIQPGSHYQSSTVEMLNTETHWDVAVIDEAQMINDRERGGGWTTAVLGVFADRVHVCMAPEGQEIIEKLITQCGDDYEVVYHKRQTPLKMEGRFNFPEDVKKGDALIVFSRKSVYMAASMLRDADIRCSVIYGALPYDVRHEQAGLFASGENDVVVATDAIGMGMNLPIRRVVFLETEKFDGVERRPLKPGEAKQIAGRAGRFGMYDVGFTATTYNVKGMIETLTAKTPPIEKARVNFPESIITIPGKLSQIIDQWMAIPLADVYERNVTERESLLCRRIESRSPSKQLTYDFITMPFAEDSRELYGLWYEMFLAEADGGTYDVLSLIEDLRRDHKGNIEALEHDYQMADLLFHYCDKFDHKDWLINIMDVKRDISDEIAKALYEQPFKKKRCSGCGRELPWNFPYKLCDDCHRVQRPYRSGHGRNGSIKAAEHSNRH